MKQLLINLTSDIQFGLLDIEWGDSTFTKLTNIIDAGYHIDAIYDSVAVVHKIN